MRRVCSALSRARALVISIACDKNDPTVNAWGSVYAVSSGRGKLTVPLAF